MMAVLSAGRLVTSGPVPWLQIGTVAVGTFLLIGPAMWAIRDRLPAGQRENLSYLAAGLALLCLPFLIGLSLLTGNLMALLDIGSFGGIMGFAAAVLIERTIIPEHLHGTIQ